MTALALPRSHAVLAGAVVVATVVALVVFGPVVAAVPALLLLSGLVLYGNPRWLVLVVLPASVLVPQNLRLRFPSLPDITLPRIVIALCLLRVLLEATLRSAPEQRSRLDRPLRWSMAAVTGLVVVNLLVTHAPGGLNRGLAITAELFLPAWLVFRSIRRADDLNTVLRTLLVVAAAACTVGVVEFGLQRALTPSSLWAQSGLTPNREGFFRAQGLFPQPIVFGIFLHMLLPVTFYFALRRGRYQRTGWVVTGLVLTALLFTLSRGPWLAALLGVVAMAALAGGRRARRLATWAAVAIGLVLASPLQPAISSLLGGLSANGQLGPGTTEVVYRQRLLEATVDFAGKHPLGVGLGNIPNLRLPVLLGGHHLNVTDSVDNAYAILVFEMGPVGLLAFAAVLACMLGVALGARRRARPDSDERLLASAMAGSMLSLFFVGFTVASFTWSQVSLLASCLLGLTAGLHRLTREAQSAPLRPRPPAVGVALRAEIGPGLVLDHPRGLVTNSGARIRSTTPATAASK